MSPATQLQRVPVVQWDGPLRYQVKSRTRKKTYFVQIDSYRWNGLCNCEDYSTRFQPILKTGINAAEAVRQGLVEVRDWQRTPENALRCWHLMEARDQFLADFGEEVDQRRKQNGGRENE